LPGRKGDGQELLPCAIQQLQCGKILFAQCVSSVSMPWGDLSDLALISLHCLARGCNEVHITAVLLGDRSSAISIIYRLSLGCLGLRWRSLAEA
jgi:hypothetical protein